MLDVKSTAFDNNQAIPKRHTGEGPDLSPPLAWSGAPSETKSFALICDDPDAPREEPWVHWVLFNLSPSLTELPENGSGGGIEGINDFGNLGYGGPMPPPGHGVHRYYFKLYALDTTVGLQQGATKQQLLDAMKGRVLDEGQLLGTYER